MNVKVGFMRIVVVIIAVVVLGLTLYFFFRTEYTVIYNGLDEVETLALQESLESEGIKARIGENNTTLEVDSERIVEAKIICNTSFALEDEVFTFSEALSSIGINKSEIDNKISIRTHEDKLANELARFDGIITADVALTIPGVSDLFISDGDESQVSAMLTVSRELTPNETDALASYFMASVEGLEMENISIVDHEYRVILAGGNISHTQENEVRFG